MTNHPLTARRLASATFPTLVVCLAALLSHPAVRAADLDITTQIATLPDIDPIEVPAPPFPRVSLSTAATPSFASYVVTLTPYTAPTFETFNPIYFQATTTIVDTSDVPVAGQVAAFDYAGAVLPSLDCTVTNNLPAATSTLTCKLPITLQSQGTPASFTVTVKAPTAGQRIKFVSETRWYEIVSPHGCSPTPPAGNFPAENEPCLETAGLQGPVTIDLTDPVANPRIAETVLPLVTGGVVTTGTGAATCDNPFVTTVNVPAAATVSLNVNPSLDTFDTTACSSPSGACQFFSRVRIPQRTFAAANPLRITLRRDRCTIEGRGIIGKALQIFEEQVFYRKDLTNAYNRVYSCHITGGPTTGNPCIRSRGIYTIFNLPNVPDKLKYLGDHFWNIEATENGKYALP